MAGRAQAFSDPTVIALARDYFIPVAEDSSALERRQDDKGEFFRHIAEQGHYGGRTFPTLTRQGSYAFTAEGRFLGSINTRSPHGMVGMLQTALLNWHEPDAAIVPSPVQLRRPVALADFPANGLVLQLTARDLPREVDTRPDDWRKGAWNLDYAWFTADEAHALVPDRREVGARRDAPWSVGRRLARFHLRDFVRGEPFSWPEEAVRQAELTAEIVAIHGAQVRLALRGAVRIEHETHWVRPQNSVEHRFQSGYAPELVGEATWDDERGAFVAFDLVAVGPRWGAQQYNNRTDDLGPAPLGIAFVLAGTAPADRTAPHCLHVGWVGAPNRRRVKADVPEYFRQTPPLAAKNGKDS